MESNAKTQWTVGIFVVSGLILIMVSIFMFGADRAVFKSYVTMKSEFEQVQGLNKGSIVSLSGINIGNVEDFVFVPGETKLQVIMKIEKERLAQITEGSQVEIRTQGALGDKFIFIIPGPINAPPMKAGQIIPVAKATDIFNIMSERGKETERVFDIINELYRMTKTINSENRLDKMLNNFAEASVNMKEVSAQAKLMTSDLANNKTQKQLKDSIERLDSILSKIDKGQGTLGALVNDSTVHNQLKNLLGGSQRKEHIKSLIRTSIERSDETTP